ncbi:Cym1 protein [Saccharomycopsis crataegensis]|uniref:Presequence protease, mitochondrial n=1 Tax=Saccharomycopsis crataegensis TaxID=43959 RepID=A0AAV5QTJ2_9ASCO|nr:Cym1 protein [Saccharomycopsis crataegensis]
MLRSNVGAALRSLTRNASTKAYNSSKVLRKYPIGQEIHGFEIKRTLAVPEFAFTAVNLEHKRSGLEYLHIDRNDKNNVFSICFKTNPTDSTGLPHILEHTTLCGSEKYPVRDPFFKMLNRSLSNFMNAMTGHDYTFYPFSTTNNKDFENLRDIYFDACFNPLLSSQDFHQEGWRLENEDPNNKETPITFKGVVYNEMKGQFSNASYLFYINFLNKIYPSLHISGGDPQAITNLSYEDLVDFHASRYHPSNAKIFSYGDLPLSENLEFLNKNLGHFGKRAKKQSRSDIKEPIDLSKSQEVFVEGPVDPTLSEDKQYKASMTWFVGKPEDVYETFVLKLLSSLLLDGHASPFFKKLIESGIGNDYAVTSGAESITDLNSFTVGLQGLSKEDIPKFEKIVNEVMEECAITGFEDQKVEAMLKQIELGKKDKKSDFGLNLLYSIVPGWVNRVDPFDSLAFDDVVNDFKINYAAAKGQFFQNVIKEKFLGKPVFKFVMKPDANYEKKVIDEEATRLSKKLETLNEEDKEVIYDRGLKLLEQQTKEEDLSCLPTLSVDKDIPRDGEVTPVDIADNLNYKLLKRITDTNGLLYFRAQKSLENAVPSRLVPYLPLFCEALMNVGTKNKTMDQLEDEIKLYTGGLSSSVYVKPSITDNLKPKLFWELRGVALNSEVGRVYDLWTEILNEVDFTNTEKLKTLIKSLNANSVSDIASSGHSYARSFASAGLSPVKEFGEYLSGVSQIKFINKLNAIVDDEEKLRYEIVSKLEEIKEILINKDNFKFGLIGDSETVESNQSLIEKFLSDLPQSNVDKSTIDYESPTYFNELRSEFFGITGAKPTLLSLPYQVSYASLGLLGTTFLKEDSASLQILSQLLTFKYLHKEVREKGGAYGGGVRYGGVDGLFGYYSYRDPNPLRSIEYFKKSADFALDNAWTAENLNEAKLTIFQSIDAPMDAKSEGMMLFRDGITDPMRQERRENLLDVNIEDIKNVTEKYLINGIKDSKSHRVAVIGPRLEEYDESKWEIIDFSS